MSKIMTLKPRMSEKTYASSQSSNVYVFEVPSTANKLTVAEAVKEQFDVTPLTVNVANIKGKAKVSYKKRSRPISGNRSDVKKAYVKLKTGDHIPVFAAVEQEEAEANKASAKKAAKEKK